MSKKIKIILGSIVGVLFLLVIAAGILIPILTRAAKSPERVSQVKGEEAKKYNLAKISPVDLKAYFNAAPTDSIHSRQTVKENHLAELPTGSQVMAGVQFQIEGIVQLMGRSLNKYGKKYPSKVEGIKIDSSCNRLYLLHGASYVMKDATPVAKLVLNYEDGSRKELNITSGENILDYWGDPDQPARADNTDLAWKGSNPWIKKWQPQLSLRLYRTGFDNPQPSVKVKSVDYVSTMTDAAPFLVAMSLE